MSPKILTINILIFRLVSNEAEVSDSVSYGSITDVHRTSQPVTSGGARTRKYSESVGRSYVASAVARSVLFTTVKYVLGVFIKIFVSQVNVRGPTVRICCVRHRGWERAARRRGRAADRLTRVRGWSVLSTAAAGGECGDSVLNLGPHV